jgi:triosephosphate isomerase
MNKTIAEAIDFVRAIRRGLNEIESVDRVLCPPYTALAALKDLLLPTGILLGAQNMHWEEKGAYTGEVSPLMLKELCQVVVLGHSERRHVIGESDELVNRKILKALSDGLEVIFCVGELLAQRESEQTDEIVARQVGVGLEGVNADAMKRVTIAYEPVWAIGTGRNATPQQAQEVHAMIRGLLADMYNPRVAQAVRIQYGGSVKPANAAEILAQPDVDGALVGGASLKASDFVGIVKAGIR